MGPETEDTIEQDILNSIGEGEDDASTGQLDSDSKSTTTSGSEGSGEGVSTSGNEGTDASSSQEPGVRHDPSTDNLVGTDGTVVAAAGKERRIYNENIALKGQITTLQREKQNLADQIEAVNRAGTVGSQFNLSPEEVTTGVQLMASFKENPIDTVKYLLTQAQASGHNIDNIGGSTDVAALKQMMETALQPFVAERQERLDVERSHQDALKMYNEFSSKYPDAKVHENYIAQLMANDPSLTPESAYLKLKMFYMERSLDWTKPLDVLQAEITQANSEQVNNQGADGSTLPSGGGGDTEVTDASETVDVNTSMDDIIKQSMAETGLTQQ